MSLNEKNVFKCSFCGESFKYKSSLKKHIETAKFCLNIQNKVEPTVENKKFICEYCNCDFKYKQNLQSHLLVCKEKESFNIKLKLREEYDKKLKDLKTEYSEIINEQKIIIAELNGKIEIYERKYDDMKLSNKIIPSFDVQVSNVLDNSINYLQSIKENQNQLNNEDMTFKIILENGEVMNIGIRSDGYINATQLCKAAGKKFNDYQRIKQTEDYLQALSFNTGIPVLDLINSNVGGNHSGTYVHRKVGYHLSQWLSPSFAVQVSNILDNLFITGKVKLGNEKSNIELENIYKEKVNNLQNELDNKTNKLKKYETTIFNRDIDICPIEYYCKDVVYFFKFGIPTHLYNSYIDDYPDINNESYKCIEFGVTSDIEERIKSQKRDRKKEELVLIHLIELDKRYTASKMEFYIKTAAKQMNINFDYEKKKECVLVDETDFNVLLNKINSGIIESFEYDTKKCLEKSKSYDKNIEIYKDIEIYKINNITELFKNKYITFEQCSKLLSINI